MHAWPVGYSYEENVRETFFFKLWRKIKVVQLFEVLKFFFLIHLSIVHLSPKDFSHLVTRLKNISGLTFGKKFVP